MNTLLMAAGAVHLVVVVMNFLLPARIELPANLAKVSPMVRQMTIVHHVYIVGILAAIAGLCFFYPSELASGRGLGRTLAAGMSIFWLARIPIQLFVYDRNIRRQNRAVDLMFIAATAFMAGVLGLAAMGGLP